MKLPLPPTEDQLVLLIDFETRSPAPLKQCGATAYARHPDTEIICCGFMLLGEAQRTDVWLNPDLYPDAHGWLPSWVVDYIVRGTGPIAAHYAGFDQQIWTEIAEPEHNFPVIEDLSRWYCTSALCRVNGLPAALDDAARAVGSMQRKDYRGAQLIRDCSIPPYDESPEKLKAMAEYCLQDMVTQESIILRCRELTETERLDWDITEEINNRGVRIDRELAELAVQYAEAERDAISARLSTLTGGRIAKHTQTIRIASWARERMDKRLVDRMVRYKDGKKRYSVDKSVRAELLDEPELPGDVRELLELTDNGNRSSVAKYQRMLDMADPNDDRVRGSYVYAGASQTQRFASRGLQVHNMRRDAFAPGTTLSHKAHMARGGDLPQVMDTLSKLLRPTLIPANGHVFVVGDWSSVEAMALPYLADTEMADKKLELFKRGEDVYMHTARELAIDDRQIGKVAELSLGFGGAVGAFSAMARNYGVKLDDGKMHSIVQSWRAANAWVVQFWTELRTAAIEVMQMPGRTYHAGGLVTYRYDPKLLAGTLLAELPDGTVLAYPQARLEEDEFGRQVITAMKASWKPKADATEWPRVRLWHGLLCENVTQAFCAALLRDALRRLERADSPARVVMHTHDEIVLEVPENLAYDAEALLREVMNTPPEWAAGLPLKAKPEIKTRYGK